MNQRVKDNLKTIDDERNKDKNMIIKGVPAQIHKRLKLMAVDQGITLSTLLIRILTDAAYGFGKREG